MTQIPDASLCEGNEDCSSDRRGHYPSLVPYIGIFKTSQPRSFVHPHPSFTHTYCISLLTYASVYQHLIRLPNPSGNDHCKQKISITGKVFEYSECRDLGCARLTAQAHPQLGRNL